MAIFCYFARMQQRKLNKELIHKSWKAFINFTAAKTVVLSWLSYHKYSNLLCFCGPPFYLVSLILKGITLPSPQAVLISLIVTPQRVIKLPVVLNLNEYLFHTHLPLSRLSFSCNTYILSVVVTPLSAFTHGSCASCACVMLPLISQASLTGMGGVDFSASLPLQYYLVTFLLTHLSLNSVSLILVARIIYMIPDEIKAVSCCNVSLPLLKIYNNCQAGFSFSAAPKCYFISYKNKLGQKSNVY